jgi:hypothetical protein
MRVVPRPIVSAVATRQETEELGGTMKPRWGKSNLENAFTSVEEANKLERLRKQDLIAYNRQQEILERALKSKASLQAQMEEMKRMMAQEELERAAREKIKEGYEANEAMREVIKQLARTDGLTGDAIASMKAVEAALYMNIMTNKPKGALEKELADYRTAWEARKDMETGAIGSFKVYDSLYPALGGPITGIVAQPELNAQTFTANVSIGNYITTVGTMRGVFNNGVFATGGIVETTNTVALNTPAPPPLVENMQLMMKDYEIGLLQARVRELEAKLSAITEIICEQDEPTVSRKFRRVN